MYYRKVATIFVLVLMVAGAAVAGECGGCNADEKWADQKTYVDKYEKKYLAELHKKYKAKYAKKYKADRKFKEKYLYHKEKHAYYRQKYEDMKDERDHYRQKYEEHKNDYREKYIELQSEYYAIKAERDHYRQKYEENQDYREQYEHYKQQYTEVKQERDEYQQNYQYWKEQYHALKESYMAYKEMYAALESDYEDMEAERDAYQEKYDTYKEKYEDLTAEYETVKAEREEYRTKMEAYREQYLNAAHDREQYREQYLMYRAMYEQRTLEYHQVREERDMYLGYKQRYEDMRENRDRLADRYDEYRSKYEDLRVEYAKMEEERDQYEAERNIYMEKYLMLKEKLTGGTQNPGDGGSGTDGDRPSMQINELERSAHHFRAQLKHVSRDRVTLDLGLTAGRFTLQELSFTPQYEASQAYIDIRTTIDSGSAPDLPHERYGVESLGYYSFDYDSHESDPGPTNIEHIITVDIPHHLSPGGVQVYEYRHGTWQPVPTQSLSHDRFRVSAQRDGTFAVGYRTPFIRTSDRSVTQMNPYTVQVSFTARNMGEVPGDREVVIRANDAVVERIPLGMEPGEERRETVNLRLDPGTYTIFVDGARAGVATFAEQPTETQPADDTQQDVVHMPSSNLPDGHLHDRATPSDTSPGLTGRITSGVSSLIAALAIILLLAAAYLLAARYDRDYEPDNAASGTGQGHDRTGHATEPRLYTGTYVTDDPTTPPQSDRYGTGQRR